MTDIQKLVDALDYLGFYNLCSTEMADKVRQQCVESNYILQQGTNRVFDLDAEDIAERGPIGFIRSVEPSLEQLGLTIHQLEMPFVQGKRADLFINGDRFMLWRMPEDSHASFWLTTTNRTLGALNSELQNEGIEDRFFASYIDNDTTVVIASPTVLDLLQKEDNIRFSEPGFHPFPPIAPLT